MLLHFFDGTIDAIPFKITLVDQHPVWDVTNPPLNTEQQEDVIGTIQDHLEIEKLNRLAMVEPIAPADDPARCPYCHRKRIAHDDSYMQCSDCHQFIKIDDNAVHMCIERSYRLASTNSHSKSAT